jgi:adenosylhomocysteine nucleosidase
MQLGIVAAFDREVQMLVGRTGSMADLQGQILVMVAGMGAECARAAGERLLNSGATALLSWGVAAALDRGLEPGSLLLPRTIVAADLSERAVSLDWHRDLCNHLAGKFVIHTEPLAESTLVLSTSAQKRALLLRSAAVAADMESAALAALAQTAHVPFVAIRAVSDTADARVPQWLSDVINDTGRVSLRYAIKGLLLHPRDWIVVSRLAFGFRAARATLTDVARQAGASLMAAAS